MQGSGNSHLENAYTSSTWEKIVDNNQELFPWTFLRLQNWYLSKALPSDQIEWVCFSAIKTSPTNTTKKKERLTAIYKPVRHDHTFKMPVEAGILNDADIWKSFNMTASGDQLIDYNTAWVGNQFRLERIFDGAKGEIGEFTIIRTINVLMWPQWPTWANWPQGIQWPLWNQWPRWYAWPTWPQWPEWCEWPPWNTGQQWPQGLQWPQGDPWDDGTSFIREWWRNSWTQYQENDVVQHNGSTRISTCDPNLNKEPWVDPCRELMALAGNTWPQWPQWPQWPAGWPVWPQGATWPSWPAGAQGQQGSQWVQGQTGQQWPQGKPWPMSDEFICMRNNQDQVFSIPQLTSEHVLVEFQNVYGNGWMQDPANDKKYIQALSRGVREISGTMWCASVPNASGDNGVNTVRMILFKSDVANNVDLTRFGFIDEKEGDQTWHGTFRFFNVAGTASIPMDTWDRVRMLSRASCDSVVPWDLMIEWPRGVPWFNGAWPNWRAILFAHKIYDQII